MYFDIGASSKYKTNRIEETHETQKQSGKMPNTEFFSEDIMKLFNIN